MSSKPHGHENVVLRLPRMVFNVNIPRIKHELPW
jgi:hypothetical protein